jgi:large subunit ribosomal protein L24e
MSHKTEIDGFAGHQIHPGHGLLHVREDKHLMAFASRKAFRMWSRKRNPRKIAWTEHYRHDHKKSTVDQVEKATRIMRKKTVRGYAGIATDSSAKLATVVVKQRVAAARKITKK